MLSAGSTEKVGDAVRSTGGNAGSTGAAKTDGDTGLGCVAVKSVGGAAAASSSVLEHPPGKPGRERRAYGTGGIRRIHWGGVGLRKDRSEGEVP